MTYTANVAVSSENVTKHSKQNEYHVVFLNVKSGGNRKVAGSIPDGVIGICH